MRTPPSRRRSRLSTDSRSVHLPPPSLDPIRIVDFSSPISSAQQNYVWSLKSQLADQEGLGSKVRCFLLPRSSSEPFANLSASSLPLLHFRAPQLPDADKKTILAALKESTDWIEENQTSATADEFEEKLAEVQAIVSPLTSKLYSGGGEGGEEAPFSHDEL